VYIFLCFVDRASRYIYVTNQLDPHFILN